MRDRRTRYTIAVLFFSVIAYIWYSELRTMPRWALQYLIAFCTALVLFEVLVRKVLLPRGVSERYATLLELIFAVVTAAAATWFGAAVYPGR